MISELTGGTSFIPETVTVFVPSTKKVLEDYISDRKKQMSDFLKKTSLSLRNSNDVFINEDDIICIYINPVDKSFCELIEKKTTYSNNLIAQLVRSECNDLQSIDLKNEGWRIEEILTRQDVYSTGCDCPDAGGTNEDYFVVQISHPELREKVFAKCEYDLQDYPNVYIVTLVKMGFLNCFLSTFKKPLIYGQSLESVRIISPTVSDINYPSQYIEPRIEFIPESYYQSEKDTTLRLAVKLGENNSNKVLASDGYKPGHIYRFKEKTTFSLLRGSSYYTGYYRMGFHDLLYLGRIDLGRYTLTAHHSLFKSGLFTDIYDMPEINEWTKDKTKSARLGGVSDYNTCISACMCINSPVDVFTLINRSYASGDNLLLKSIVESGDSMTEEEYINYLTKVLSDVKDNAYSRYLVLPATELTSDKRNHSFDLQLEQDERFKRIVTDRDKPTGYHIYTDIVDLGEFVRIKSPVKKFMKNIMLRVEGKDKEITFKRLKQYVATPEGSVIYSGISGSGVVNLDSYNLFSEEELNQLDPIIFNSLKSNLTDLILKVLYLYCLGFSDYIVNSNYRNKFNKNVFVPEYSLIKNGLLKRLNDTLQNFWATKPSNSNIYSFKKTIEGFIINELGKGAQKDDIVYRNNGIFDTIKKYKITESDFKKCAEFLS